MPSRSFTDPHGVSWMVWEVTPAEHRDSGELDRHLPAAMTRGWLCFQSDRQKRRLAPIPSGWRERSDAELWMYCRVAEPVRTLVAEPAAGPAGV
jgi:hypothetical protein